MKTPSGKEITPALVYSFTRLMLWAKNTVCLTFSGISELNSRFADNESRFRKNPLGVEVAGMQRRHLAATDSLGLSAQ